MLNQVCKACLKWYKELKGKYETERGDPERGDPDYNNTVIPKYCVTYCQDSQVPKYLHISQVIKWLEMKNDE